jgi:hypothetical protein
MLHEGSPLHRPQRRLQPLQARFYRLHHILALRLKSVNKDNFPVREKRPQDWTAEEQLLAL